MSGPIPRNLALQTAIVAHLKAAGRPATSRALAALFLRIEHGDEATCRKLLSPFLLSVPGVVHREGEGWSLARLPRASSGSPASAAPPEAPLPDDPPEPVDRRDAAASSLRDFVALASEGGGPGGSGGLRALSLLPVLAGEECQEEHFPESSGTGEEEGVTVRARLSEDDLHGILETIGDLPVVCHRVGRELDPLRRACAAAGLPFQAPVISAAKLGHLLLGLKANHSLEDLGAAVRLTTRGPEDCRGRIRTVAAAYLGLLPLLDTRAIDSVEALLEFQNMPAAPLDLSRYGFTEDDLRALPAAPGVYRFLDGAGRILYIGRSKNLRVRVASYFTPSSGQTPRGRAILDQVRTFAVDTVATELEAILLEAALILEHRPPLNRQFDVHERPAPYGPRLNLVVVLPERAAAGDEPAACTLHLLRGGRYLGRIGGVPESAGAVAAEAAGRVRAAY
ncbi:MAG: GIY-YIG nuclease family protein, partial [Candidatus Polarisedimenticolia bacterium]